jgi:fumarylacetoacetase
MEALAPFRVPAFKRFEGDPEPLPHLRSAANDRSGHVSINVEAHITPALGSPQRLSRANYCILILEPGSVGRAPHI